MTRRASETLTAYLATTDVPCHRCGYNLRGCTEPVCPECGTVIPRPLDQDRQQALRCLACGCELGLVRHERCPRCGSDDIFLGRRSTLPTKQTTWLRMLTGGRLWKGVPRTLWMAAFLSVVFGVPTIATYMGRTVFLGGGPATFASYTTGRIALGACTFAPAISALLWFAFRRHVNSTPPRTRARIALVAMLGSGSLSVLSWIAWL